MDDLTLEENLQATSESSTVEQEGHKIEAPQRTDSVSKRTNSKNSPDSESTNVTRGSNAGISSSNTLSASKYAKPEGVSDADQSNFIAESETAQVLHSRPNVTKATKESVKQATLESLPDVDISETDKENIPESTSLDSTVRGDDIDVIESQSQESRTDSEPELQNVVEVIEDIPAAHSNESLSQVEESDRFDLNQTSLKVLEKKEVKLPKMKQYEEIDKLKKGCGYVSRYLKYLDKKQEANKSGHEEMPSLVEQLVRDLFAKINSDKVGFKYSRPVQCGSFKEGVKVTHFNEFDFMITLCESSQSGFVTLDTSILELKHCTIPLTKPKKTSTSMQQKAFFKIFIDEDKATEKGLDRCTDITHESVKLELCAHKVQNTLCAEVKQVLGHECHVEESGPAVSIYVTRESDKQVQTKIDLTIGIKKELKNEELAQFGITLKSEMLNNCYFVPANSYWRMSFSDQESTRIKELVEEDKRCLRALKVLRDELVTGREQQTILDTYPLKVSLLNIAENTNNPRELGETALQVLEHIETKGAKHELEDSFIHGNSILYESDKSYLESVRILQHLKEQNHEYVSSGKWHTIILSLILAMFLVIASGCGYFYFSAVANFTHIGNRTLREEDCLDENVKFEKYSYYLQGAVWFLIGLTGVGGLGYQLFQRFCFKQRVYKVFECGLLWIYIFVLSFSFALFIVHQLIVNDMIDTTGNINVECKLTTKAKTLSFIIFIISCVMVGIAFCYTVVFAIQFSARFKGCPKSPFDFFFCDDYCGFYNIRYRKPKYQNAFIDNITEGDCHI